MGTLEEQHAPLLSRDNHLSRTWRQFVGSAACEPVFCGGPPVFPNAVSSRGTDQNEPWGHVKDTRLARNTLNGTSCGRTQFNGHRQGVDAFTVASLCLVSRANPSAGNDVITDVVESDFATTDAATDFFFSVGPHCQYLDLELRIFCGLSDSLRELHG